MKNAHVIGEKIYLRPLEKSDASTLAAWFNDPEVNRSLGRHGPMSLLQEEAWLEKLGSSESDLVLGVALKADDRLVGSVGFHFIHRIHRHAIFGIAIGAKEEWDKGYGTEATRLLTRYGFENLNLHRIELRVFAFNERAIHVYERAGYRREGVLRQEHYVDGRYHDSIVMSILRPEWDARPGDSPR